MGAAVRSAPEALRGGAPVITGSGPAPLPVALASGQCGQKLRKFMTSDFIETYRQKRQAMFPKNLLALLLFVPIFCLVYQFEG